MCTARSNVEIADWNGRTTSPDGEKDVTDAFGGDGSPVLSALRAALGRVISTIRAFVAAQPAQAETRNTEAPRFGDAERVEAAKYHSPAPPFPAGGENLPEWPQRPGLTLLAVDPYLVHAYWDFDPAKLPPGTTAAALRFYDAASHFDVDIDVRTRSWYVPLWAPARTYYADLGAIAAGEFIPLLRSNTIQTPRAWPVAEVEHRFAAGAGASPRSEEQAARQPPPPGPEHAVAREIRVRADGPPLAAEPSAAQAVAGLAAWPAMPPAHHAGGVWEAAPRTAQPDPHPPGAAEILRRRLSEIYELRQWQPRAQSAGVKNPQGIPPPQATPDSPRNLTERAEREFSPGVSSLLVAAAGPHKPDR
jgi:hypothetical protein